MCCLAMTKTGRGGAARAATFSHQAESDGTEGRQQHFTPNDDKRAIAGHTKGSIGEGKKAQILKLFSFLSASTI